MTSEKNTGTPSSQWSANGEQDPHGRGYDCERAALTLGHLTDDELANGAYMNYDKPLNLAKTLASEPGYYAPIAWMTAVKERIRWLSRSLEKATQAAAPDLNKIKSDAVMEFASVFVGAFETGFVDTPHATIAQIFQVARHHVQDSFGVDTKNLLEEVGQESYDACCGKGYEPDLEIVLKALNKAGAFKLTGSLDGFRDVNNMVAWAKKIAGESNNGN